MKKYLDINGLLELWRRISTAFATKSDVEDGIAESLAEGGAVRGAIAASMEGLSRVSETGSYLDLSDTPTVGIYRQISVRVLQGIDKLYIDGADDLIAAGCRPVLFRYCRKRNKPRRGRGREGVAQGKHEKWKKGWNAMGGQGVNPVTAAVKIEQDKYGYYLCIAPKMVWGKDTNFHGWWHDARKFIHQKNSNSASFSGRNYALRETTDGETTYLIRRFTYGVAFVKPTDNPYKAGTRVIDKSRLASNIAPFRLCYQGGRYNEEQPGMGIDETPEGAVLDAVDGISGDDLTSFVEDDNVLSQDIETRFKIIVQITDESYLVIMRACNDSSSLWLMLGHSDLVAEVEQKAPEMMDALTYERTITKDTFEAEHTLLYYDGEEQNEGVSDMVAGEAYLGYDAIMEQISDVYGTDREPCFFGMDYVRNLQGWHWCFGK